MIVVDSSVWIELLRGTATPQVLRLGEAADRNEVIVGDLILCEVLRGARDDAKAAEIALLMSAYPVVAMAGADIAVQAAANFRRLRSLGATVRSTIDLIIGTWCIESDVPLLHVDRDFEAMERHLGLKIA